MAHILYKYIWIALEAVLGRPPIEEEYKMAIRAVGDYAAKAFILSKQQPTQEEYDRSEEITVEKEEK